MRDIKNVTVTIKLYTEEPTGNIPSDTTYCAPSDQNYFINPQEDLQVQGELAL